MSEELHEENLRLVGTCPSCKSDRIYVTYLIAGLGMPSIVAVECAACENAGQSWDDPKAGMVIKWNGSEDVVPTRFVVPDTQT